MVTAMGRHAENATLQEEAGWFLHNLADNNPENKQRIKRGDA